MDLARLLRHLATPSRIVRRRFPTSALNAIEAAIAAAEQRHEPEIRFAVEGALHPRALIRGSRRAIALSRCSASCASGTPSTTPAC